MKDREGALADSFFVFRSEKTNSCKMSARKIHLSLYGKYYIIAHSVCNEVHVYIRKKGKKSVEYEKTI